MHLFPDVPTTVVSRPPGIATETTTVPIGPMSHPSIVRARDAPASAICSRVTTATVFPASTFVTGTMTVWTTRMRTPDTSVVSSFIDREKSLVVAKVAINPYFCIEVI